MHWKASIGAVFGLVALQASAQGNATGPEGAVSVQGGHDYGKPPSPPTVTKVITTTEICKNQPSASQCPPPSQITVTYHEPPNHGSSPQPCPSNSPSTVTIVTTSIVNEGGHPGQQPSNCANCPKSCTPTKTHTDWSTKTHTEYQKTTKTVIEYKTKTEYSQLPASTITKPASTTTVRT